MKKRSLKFKILVFVMIVAFTFQSLNSINNHTYTTGIDNFHYDCGCFGCWPDHLAQRCMSNNPLHSDSF